MIRRTQLIAASAAMISAALPSVVALAAPQPGDMPLAQLSEAPVANTRPLKAEEVARPAPVPVEAGSDSVNNPGRQAAAVTLAERDAVGDEADRTNRRERRLDPATIANHEVAFPAGAVTAAAAGDTCLHAITMWDDFGDGWNGGFIDVYVNGNMTTSGVTLATGTGPETIYFSAATGDAITTAWTQGNFYDEPSYCIYDINGVELACDGLDGYEPLGVALTGNCVTTGACCDPFTGTCTNGVEFSACQDPMQITLGTLCTDINPPCGDPGACCLDSEASCTNGLRADCNSRFVSGEQCGDLNPACGDYHECDHRIVIDSSNQSSWNSGFTVVNVYVNGVQVLSDLTVGNNESVPKTYYFTAGDLDQITTELVSPFGFTPPAHAEYCIYDATGNQLACDGDGEVVPTGITVSGMCSGTGACCNPFDGTCTDNVDVWNCQLPLQYTHATLCGDLAVPCGNPGACCDQQAGTCVQDFEANCTGRFKAGEVCTNGLFVPACGANNTCDVLIVPAETEFEYTSGNDFMDRLAARTFSDVDFMDGTVNTPTLAELQAYDMVITYADNNYADKYAMGDVLADYVETGGRVLLGNYSVYTQGNWTWLDGRIIDEYNPAQVTAPNNYGVTYQEDGADCIFDGISEYEALGSDVITGPRGPAFLDGTYYDPDPWAGATYAPVAAIRYDRSVMYVSGHLAGYVAFNAEDREELAKLTANMCFCEPDDQLLGACCNPSDGTCTDNVAVTSCMPPMQWTKDTLCANLPEPCGNPGACCDDTTGDCAETTERSCTGRFVAGETCTTAVFDPPCGVSGAYDVLYAPTSGDSPRFRAELSAILSSNVDYLDTRVNTPTVAELLNYAAVIHWVDNPHADGTGEALGDVLADYVDAGGKVILGIWSFAGAGQNFYLQGRLAEAYNPVVLEGNSYGGGDYDGSGTDCIHEGINMYGSPVIDIISDVTPEAWYDGMLADSDGNSSIAVAYLLDRSVHYISGFDGGNLGPGDWSDLVANIIRCPATDVYGACCDSSDGSCSDGVRKQDCLPPLEWTHDTLCADLDPGCGLPGACCDDVTGNCSETVFAQCNGRFTPGVTCATAVFNPPCGSYQGCQHSITLYDENPPENGWFGWFDATVDVYVGGLPRFLGLTLIEGEGSNTLYFDAEDGEIISTVWHKGWLDGTWDHLAAYCVRGLDGTTLGCDGLGLNERPAGISGPGSCVDLECGNSICQIEGGENCSSCPADCGDCRCVDQPMIGSSAYLSDLDCQACGGSIQVLADDFTIYQAKTVSAVRFMGTYTPGDSVPADDFTVTLRADLVGYPDAELASFPSAPVTRTDVGGGDYEYTVQLGVTLAPGKYWIQIHNNTVGSAETWGWYDGTVDVPFGDAGISYSADMPEIWQLASSLDMTFELICSNIPGDLDGDGDVDLDDHALFVGCMNGPEVSYPTGCDLADLDLDGDVDLVDFAAFSNAMSANLQ